MEAELHFTKDKPEETQVDFRLLAESSTDMISRYNPEGIYLYVSPACRSLLGYDPEELVGHSAYELLHPDDLPKIQTAHAAILQSFEMVTVTYRLRRKDEQYRWFETSAHSMRDTSSGKLLEIQASSRDITRRMETEIELKRSQAHLAGIINVSADAIISVDEQHCINLFNPAAEKMFGYPSSQVLGQPLERFLPAQLRVLHEQYITTFDATTISYRTVKRFATLLAHRANGEQFPIEASVAQIAIENEKIFTIIIRDETERRQAEETLRKSEEQLRQAQKMEAVGRLAGGIVHDFNNLLTAILGCSELVLLNLAERDPLYEDVIQIKKSVERATILTRQLLMFTRNQPHDVHQFDLNQLVNDFANLLERMVGEDIKLVKLLDETPALIAADPNQLEQIMMNLAVNARDAMSNGGKLIFETTKVQLDYEFTRQYPQFQPGSYVLLTVSDTGCGMDKFTLERIFEPFFTTKAIGKGTGLGLSIVYGLVQQNEGQILVYSEVGVGTTFKIYFPQTITRIEDKPPLPENLARLSPRTSAETILIVEDDTAVRELLIKVLQTEGYQLLVAATGQEALSIAHRLSQPLNLVLTDMILPDLTGSKLIESLKQIRPELKAIYMTGYSEGLVKQQNLLQPDLTFLTKPFSINTLLDTLNNVLNTIPG